MKLRISFQSLSHRGITTESFLQRSSDGLQNTIELRTRLVAFLKNLLGDLFHPFPSECRLDE